QFGEVGAGIQLGPNATRVLAGWDLEPALRRVASFPSQLRVRSAESGAELGRLALGELDGRYGSPYATVHRADLHGLLLRESHVDLKAASAVHGVAALEDAVTARVGEGPAIECDALIGADGLWSVVRRSVWGDGPPHATGHVAYRALAVQSALPEAIRSVAVTAWLGPHMHVVAYPVRAGELLNVVAIVDRGTRPMSAGWDEPAVAANLHAAMGAMCAPLQDLVHAMPSWRLWTLHDRTPMRSADEMAKGRVALAGDAAHPMRPYFAQGGAMALEDAAEIGRCLAMADRADIDVPLALRRYALNRWERCAKVQALSRRNGRIFHARGLVRIGRDVSMKLLGERLLDQPWLYRA
ncbi:MAG TPA: FAD-dependent monooxygenase, partial [Ramlibacter sp.]|nr:FAD-dependent monooxygenase [Ramlibacter sp.]